MPQPPNLWDRIDDLAKVAVQEHGDARTGFILTQVAEIGRAYKTRGIRELYEAINLHCASLLSDSLEVLSRRSVKKKRVDPTLKSV